MNFMDLKDTFCTLIGAYYGMQEMDEYGSKEYVLFDLQQYILNFVKNHSNLFPYQKLAQEIEKKPLKTKLQDCLLILPKINVPMDLIFLIQSRLREIREQEISE